MISLSQVVGRGNFGEFFANHNNSIKFEDCVANIDDAESLGRVRDSTAFSNFMQLCSTAYGGAANPEHGAR